MATDIAYCYLFSTFTVEFDVQYIYINKNHVENST